MYIPEKDIQNFFKALETAESCCSYCGCYIIGLSNMEDHILRGIHGGNN